MKLQLKDHQQICYSAVESLIGKIKIQDHLDKVIDVSLIDEYDEYYIFKINGVEVGILKKNIDKK